MAVNADIFTERENWKNPLAWSVAAHAIFFASLLLYSAVFGHMSGDSWGGGFGGGEAISARMVSSIPLPAPPVQTQNILANESKGLTQTLPKPAIQPDLPDAIPIQEKSTPKRKTAPPREIAREKPVPQPVEPPPNVVAFGQGGPVSGPYGAFSTPNAKGGFGFTGGGGDFGNRYAWYVRVVQQKVSENWLKYEVDPSVTNARRVYITFNIARNGQPTDIRIEQSSGVPSLDQSAVRALQRIDTFGPLPNDYPGSAVSVEFWFDYRR